MNRDTGAAVAARWRDRPLNADAAPLHPTSAVQRRTVLDAGRGMAAKDGGGEQRHGPRRQGAGGEPAMRSTTPAMP